IVVTRGVHDHGATSRQRFEHRSNSFDAAEANVLDRDTGDVSRSPPAPSLLSHVVAKIARLVSEGRVARELALSGSNETPSRTDPVNRVHGEASRLDVGGHDNHAVNVEASLCESVAQYIGLERKVPAKRRITSRRDHELD